MRSQLRVEKRRSILTELIRIAEKRKKKKMRKLSKLISFDLELGLLLISGGSDKDNILARQCMSLMGAWSVSLLLLWTGISNVETSKNYRRSRLFGK